MSIKPTGLHHVSVVVTDLDRACAFYRDVLALEEVPKPSTFNFTVAWFHFGDCQVHLIPRGEADDDSPRHFALHVEDAKAAREHIRERDCEVAETTPIPGADRFFTRDPDGNLIELIQWLEEYVPGA